MSRSPSVRALTFLTIAFLSFPPIAHAGGPTTKLGRGIANVITGWVEIPKRITETSQTQGVAAGITWGLLRGFGYGFVRTAAGFYEFFTFPFSAPPDYEPVIQPEYVFMEEEYNQGR